VFVVRFFLCALAAWRENGFYLSGNAYRRNLTYDPGNR
jgi:hypothetical protein